MAVSGGGALLPRAAWIDQMQANLACELVRKHNGAA